MRSSPKFYSFIAQVVGTPELSRGQLERLHQLGAKVGLSRREVHAALAAQAEPRKRVLPGWLLALVITFAIMATLVGVWAVVYVSNRGYIPGTLYAALSSHDFD
jgi:hypothetical protein